MLFRSGFRRWMAGSRIPHVGDSHSGQSGRASRFDGPSRGKPGCGTPYHPSRASGQLPPRGFQTIEQNCKWGGMGCASRLHGPRAPDGWASHPVRRGQLGMRNPLAPRWGIQANPTLGVPNDGAALQMEMVGMRIPPQQDSCDR